MAGGEIALVGPSTLAELKDFASAAAKTGFYGAKTAEQALLIAATGRDLGLSYTAALRLFHVIEGRPALSADGMVAIVLASGQCDYFETVESSPAIATVKTRRKGRGERAVSFTIDEARQAGLTGKGNWAKYPAAMLRARAKSALARDVYPDLLAGIYDPDELSTATAEPLTAIVEAKAAAVAPAQTAEMMASLCAQLAQATTPEDFAAIAKGAVALPDAWRDVFRARFKARKAAIAQTPAEPPPFVELGDTIPEPSAPVSEELPSPDEAYATAFGLAIERADSVTDLESVGNEIRAAKEAGFVPPKSLSGAYRAKMRELADRDLS